MTTSADPYFILLGLAPGERPPSHYELLGVAESETRPDAIAAAADARLAHVSKFLTGPSAAAAQRLIGEIATAKAILTTPAARADYDANRRKAPSAAARPKPASARENSAARTTRSTALPPVPPRAAATKRAATPAVPVRATQPTAAPRLVTPPAGVDFAPTAVVAATAPATATFVVADDSARPAQARRAAARDRRMSWLQLGSVACLLGAASLGAGTAWKWRSAEQTRQQSSSPPANRRSLPDRTAPPSIASPPIDAATPRTSAVPPTRDDDRPPMNASSVAIAPSPPADAAAVAPPVSVANDAPVALPELSAERRRRMSLALAAARDALAQRDIDAAAEQIDLAAVTASGSALTEVAAARAAQQRLQKFWDAVAQGQGGLAAGEEIPIDGKPVAVVESADDRLVIRASGRNETYGRGTLPAALAIVLAHRALTGDLAERSLCDGAFQLLDAAGDPAAGRKLLETAAAGGSDEAAAILAAFAPVNGETAP